MIISFKDEATEDIFNGVASKKALKVCPESRWNVARRKLDQLNFAVSLEDLKIPPGNQLEALQGDREGQHSIRINQQYRICFTWIEEGAEDVEIVDYH
jgi:toxin HigB-1